MSVSGSKVLRSALCLVLAIVMALGTCVSALAAEKDDAPPPPPEGSVDEPEKKLHYVSLGDSMTNGYGLTGYDMHGSNGYLEIAEDAYPWRVADNYKWELTQLATSAMRVEDLNYILGGNFAGDDWTFDELVNDDRRWDSAWANEQPESVQDTFVQRVTGADVITMAAGNANFGVFLLGRITNALGLFGSAEEDAWINFESALTSLDAESKAVVMDMYNKVLAYAEGKLPAELAEPLTKAVGYTLVSFVLNYNGALDRIVELNPDAEIIIVGLMNTMSGYVLHFEYQGETYTIDMEQILNLLIQPMNGYLAVLPAVKQAKGEYAEAKIYYTDVDTIAVMSQSYRDLYMNVGNYVVWMDEQAPVAGNNTVRERFVKGIANFIGELMGNEALEGMELADVLRYESNPVAYAIGDPDAASAVAMYLGLEEAVLVALEAEDLTVDLDEILGSAAGSADAFLGNILGDVMTDIASNVPVNAAEKIAEAMSAVAESMGIDEATVQAAYGVNDSITNAVNGYAALLATPETIVETMTGNDLVLALLNLYGRLKMGDGLSAHPSAAGHAQLTAAIIKAYDEKHTVQDDIKETVQLGLNELYYILETYGPEVAAQVWAQWEEYGYVDQVNNSIEGLKATLSDRYTYYTETALPAIEAAVGSLAAQKESLCTELTALNTELAAKKAELAEVLAQQEIGGIYIPDINIDVELGGNEQTEVPEHECVVAGDDVAAELEAAIADLEHAIAVIEALIADITADMEDLLALAEQIAAAVEELELTLASIVEAADDLAAAIEAAVAVLEDNEGVINAVIASFDAARATVLAAVDVVELTLGTAETMIADIDAMIGQIGTDAEALYNKFITDLPACIAALPEEAQMLIGGAVLLAQQGLEEGKALIEAKLAEEIAALAANPEYSCEALEAQLIALAEEYGINETAIQAEIDAIKAQIEAEVSARYEAIEAETLAQITALETEAQAKLEALNAELAAYQAELEAAAEEAKAEIQTQIDRVTGDIATVNEDLACAIEHLENAAQIAYDEIVAEVEAAYEAAMAELETALADLEAAYNAAVAEVEAQLAELKAAYDAAVAELTAAADAAIAELQAAVDAQIAELGKLGEDLAAVVDGIFAELHEDLNAAQTAIAEILAGNLEAAADLAEALVNMGAESLVDAYEAVKAQVENMFREATTDDYVISEDSYYVALGDASAAADSYVEELAAYFGIEHKNLAQAGLMMDDAFGVIADNSEDIAKADLITIGFSNTAFVPNALNAAYNGNDLDWSAYVTEDGVTYVDQALAEISVKLTENGITGELNEMALDAIESYAFSSMVYACTLPEVVNAIRTVNSDAVVIIVGQHNAFTGTVISIEGVEIDLSEYIDYLVTGAAVHGIAYCMLTDNAIYVEAPDAATNTPAEIGLRDLLQIMSGNDSALYPNATGHEYIKNQILKALNISVEEPAGLWGDADSDGDVDNIDSMLVLQYFLGLPTSCEVNTAVCDVDGVNGINNIDAMLILQHFVGIINSFPVEQ